MLFCSHGYQPREKLKRYQIKFPAAKIRGSSLLSRRLTCTALQLPYLHYHIIRANEYPLGVCRSQSAINAKKQAIPILAVLHCHYCICRLITRRLRILPLRYYHNSYFDFRFQLRHFNGRWNPVQPAVSNNSNNNKIGILVGHPIVTRRAFTGATKNLPISTARNHSTGSSDRLTGELKCNTAQT